MDVVRLYFERLIKGFTTMPRREDWAFAAVLLPIFAAATGALGFATGFLHIAPVSPLYALKTAALSLVIPALAEETLFRGYLPNWAETRRPLTWMGVSVIVFVLWHIAQTLVLKGAAPIFLRADFLATSALLGTICGVLRMRSGSLWPGVIFHWIVVAGWLIALGGPKPGDLL